MESSAVVECSSGTLAGSLTRVAASPAQTQHLHDILGDYCHQFRNVLNCLKMSLYLARMSADPQGQGVWLDLESRYLHVEQFIDRLQLICRPIPPSFVKLPLSLLFDDREASWSETLASHEKRLILVPPAEPIVGSYDPIRLAPALDALVAWRSHAGDPETDLRVRWDVENEWFQIRCDEPVRTPRELDSAPLGDDDTDAFESLTVPLLARIATLHGGSLEVARSDPWRLELRWPIDAGRTPCEAPRCRVLPH